MRTFGETLKAIRGDRSQVAFAKKWGISRTTLSEYERGIVPIERSLIKFKIQFGFDLSDFITQEDIRASKKKTSFRKSAKIISSAPHTPVLPLGYQHRLNPLNNIIHLYNKETSNELAS